MSPEILCAAREVLAALKRRDAALVMVHAGALSDLILADAAREDAVADNGPANDIALAAAAANVDDERACRECECAPCQCGSDPLDYEPCEAAS